MKTKVVITVAAIAMVLLCLCLLVCMPGKRQPEYKGRTLASWLVHVDDGYRERGAVFDWAPWTQERSVEQAEADEAIRQMGTNSLSRLLQYLTYRDSFVKARIRLLQKKQLVYPAYRRQAVLAFAALGSLAKPAIPKLTEILYRGPLDGGKEASAALAAIGPEGWAVLTQAVLSTNSGASLCSIWALGSHHASVPGTVAALTAVFTNNSFGNSSIAAWALGAIGEESDSVVPLLIRGLQASDRDLRLGCAVGLGPFGRKAQTAVPALKQALEGSDQHFRHCADESLKQISTDPATGSEKK